MLFFDYPKAAQTFDTVSKVGHFNDDERRGAAQQAMSLYASLGDAKGMKTAHDRFVSLGAEPAQVAEADFVLASAAAQRMGSMGPDTGANAAARKRAEGAMRTYYEQYRNNPAARSFRSRQPTGSLK